MFKCWGLGPSWFPGRQKAAAFCPHLCPTRSEEPLFSCLCVWDWPPGLPTPLGKPPAVIPMEPRLCPKAQEPHSCWSVVQALILTGMSQSAAIPTPTAWLTWAPARPLLLQEGLWALWSACLGQLALATWGLGWQRGWGLTARIRAQQRWGWWGWWHRYPR